MLKLFSKQVPNKEQVEIVTAKVDCILKAIQPLKILLIGSASRLGMREHSDVDLVVIVADGTDHKKAYGEITKKRDYSGDPWPQDLLIVEEGEFQKKSQIGGIYFIAREDGVEVYPQFNLRVSE